MILLLHQSKESKYKYSTKVLNPNGTNTYIKADTFLKKLIQINQKDIPIYIGFLKFYSEIICDPRVNTYSLIFISDLSKDDEKRAFYITILKMI